MQNKQGWMVAIGLLTLGCTPSVPVDPSGQPSLTFESLRNDGMSVSDVYFILDNRSPRAISFQASKAFWSSAAYPTYTSLSCTDPSGRMSDSIFSLEDSQGGPPPFITVSPGSRLRLSVAEHGNEIAQQRGDICRLRLQLKGDEVIESKPFHPVVAF